EHTFAFTRFDIEKKPRNVGGVRRGCARFQSADYLAAIRRFPRRPAVMPTERFSLRVEKLRFRAFMKPRNLALVVFPASVNLHAFCRNLEIGRKRNRRPDRRR